MIRVPGCGQPPVGGRDPPPQRPGRHRRDACQPPENAGARAGEFRVSWTPRWSSCTTPTHSTPSAPPCACASAPPAA